MYKHLFGSTSWQAAFYKDYKNSITHAHRDKFDICGIHTPCTAFISDVLRSFVPDVTITAQVGGNPFIRFWNVLLAPYLFKSGR